MWSLLADIIGGRWGWAVHAWMQNVHAFILTRRASVVCCAMCCIWEEGNCVSSSSQVKGRSSPLQLLFLRYCAFRWAQGLREKRSSAAWSPSSSPSWQTPQPVLLLGRVWVNLFSFSKKKGSFSPLTWNVEKDTPFLWKEERCSQELLCMFKKIVQNGLAITLPFHLFLFPLQCATALGMCCFVAAADMEVNHANLYLHYKWLPDCRTVSFQQNKIFLYSLFWLVLFDCHWLFWWI